MRARYAMYSLVNSNGNELAELFAVDDAEVDGLEDDAGFAGVEYDDDGGGASGSVQRAILSGAHTTAHRSKVLWPPRSAACRSPSTMRKAVWSVSATCHSSISVHMSCEIDVAS